MTVLQRPERLTTDHRPGSRPGSVLGRARALAMAALAGALAAVVSLMVISVPVVIAWFAEQRSTVSLWQTMGIAVDVWALAHRGVVQVGQVQVAFAPLLLTVVPLLACRYAVNQVLVDRPEARGDLTEVKGARVAWRALAGPELAWFVTGYLAGGLVMCSLAGLGQAPVDVASVVPGLLLVPLGSVVLGLWREHRRQEHPSIDRGLRWVQLHTPVLVRRGLGPAGETLGLLAAAALVLVIALLVLRAERIGALYAALDAGAVGTTVLTLAQVLALPNLMVWALGWTTGAAVDVGTVAVGWSDTTSGDLPLIPVLAALPEPGGLPPGLWLSVLVPVLAGGWLGWRSAGAAPRLASWWTKGQIAGSAWLGVVLVVLLLSWLATGGMTPGVLGVVGTDPLVVAGALACELLVGALVMVTLRHLLRSRMRSSRSRA